MPESAWAIERLGAAAEELQAAIVRAIPRAHEHAVAAQAVSGTAKQDPYGHTMKNRQHECLVEDAREISGIRIVHPAGTSFQLVTVVETQVVLYPWRYATDNSRSREDVRMSMSKFRQDLLTSPSRQPRGQLALDQADWDDEAIEEDEAVVEQLQSLVRVVPIGYRSNVSGLFELGWGDLELLDSSGAIHWRHWERLEPVLSDGRAPGARPATAPQPETGSAATATPPRWDEVSALEGLGLSARDPRPDQTGSGDGGR